MNPRVCADALYSDFLAHLKGCADCQMHPVQLVSENPTLPFESSCPEGWALLKAWGDQAKRERAESVASEMQDCVDEL